MRITVSLDEDVLEKARLTASQLRVPFKTVVNQALRLGLSKVGKPARQQRYQTIPHAMGLRNGYSLDNIQELLTQAEGHDFR